MRRTCLLLIVPLLMLTGCLAPQVIVVTATPQPTLPPTLTAAPTATRAPTPTPAPTATPKSDLLPGEAKDYLPTIDDMPAGCRFIPAGSGAMRSEELTGHVVTFFCPDFALSGRNGNFMALALLLPTLPLAQAGFRKWADDDSMMKPEFYIDRDTGMNLGPAEFEDVTLELSTGESRMVYGQAGLLGNLCMVMRVKNLIVFLTVKGFASSHQSDEYFRREAENYGELVIARTRR